MKKIISILIIITIGFNINLFAEEKNIIKRISEGDENAKIKIITEYSRYCVTQA